MDKEGNFRRNLILGLGIFAAVIALGFVVYAAAVAVNPGHSYEEVYVFLGGATKTLQTAINDKSLVSALGGGTASSPVFGHTGNDVNITIKGNDKTLQKAIDDGDFVSLCVEGCPAGSIVGGFIYAIGSYDTFVRELTNGDGNYPYSCLGALGTATKNQQGIYVGRGSASGGPMRMDGSGYVQTCSCAAGSSPVWEFGRPSNQFDPLNASKLWYVPEDYRSWFYIGYDCVSN